MLEVVDLRGFDVVRSRLSNPGELEALIEEARTSRPGVFILHACEQALHVGIEGEAGFLEVVTGGNEVLTAFAPHPQPGNRVEFFVFGNPEPFWPENLLDLPTLLQGVRHFALTGTPEPSLVWAPKVVRTTRTTRVWFQSGHRAPPSPVVVEMEEEVIELLERFAASNEPVDGEYPGALVASSIGWLVVGFVGDDWYLRFAWRPWFTGENPEVCGYTRLTGGGSSPVRLRLPDLADPQDFLHALAPDLEDSEDIPDTPPTEGTSGLLEVDRSQFLPWPVAVEAIRWWFETGYLPEELPGTAPIVAPIPSPADDRDRCVEAEEFILEFWDDSEAEEID